MVQKDEEFVNKLFPEIDCFLSSEELKRFSIILKEQLLIHKKTDRFIDNIEQLKRVLFIVGFNIGDIARCIMSWPAIISQNKQDLLYKYLLLAKVSTYKEPHCIRDEIFINSANDLIPSVELIYARMKFFLSGEGKGYLRKNVIGRKPILELSNDDFQAMYKYSSEDLKALYPFSKEKMAEVMAWPENRELVSQIRSRIIR